MPALCKACASPDGEMMAVAMSHLAKLEDELEGKRFLGGEAIGLVDLRSHSLFLKSLARSGSRSKRDGKTSLQK